MENVRIRFRLEFIKKYEYKKQQSKLAFAGIHKSYENCDSFLFKKNEVPMNKLYYLGNAVLKKVSYKRMRHNMINCNHILDRKIFNYTIWTPMLSF